MQNNKSTSKNYDKSILNKNIRMHMKRLGMTQTELGNALHLSQPDISKRLKNSEKQGFTVEQVVEIAALFSISVDELLGIKTNESSESYYADVHPKNVCRFLIRLFESHRIKADEQTITEHIYEKTLDPQTNQHIIREKKTDSRYPIFRFPNYFSPFDPFTEDEVFSKDFDFEQQGNNDLPPNWMINDFIDKYMDAYYGVMSGKYTRDQYNKLVATYLELLE